MEYAKIVGGRVARITSQIPDEGTYLPLIDNTDYDTEYNRICYEFKCNIPDFIISSIQVLSVKTLVPLPVDIIKDKVFGLQKKKRQEKQLGSFLFEGIDIPLKDREDSLIITSLPEIPTNFKVGSGVWKQLSTEEIVAFKQAHHNHVQVAYTWEMEENTKVVAMTTISELSAYIEEIL